MKQVIKTLSEVQRKKNKVKLDMITVGTTLLQPTKKGRLVGVVEGDENGKILLSVVDGKEVVECVTKPYRLNERTERVLMNIATVNVVLE